MKAWLLWLLILALPAYGASAAQLRVTGPAHWHAGQADAAGRSGAEGTPSWLSQLVDEVQRLRDEAHLRAHALGRAAAPHSHFGLQHHWHASTDDSVRPVADPAVADLVAGAEVGSAMLVLAVPPQCLHPAVRRPNGRWPPASPSRWADVLRPPASPPPRA